MRFDPKRAEKKGGGISPFSLRKLVEVLRGKNRLPGKGLFIRNVYRNYSIFNLVLLFINPTHVSWADSQRANGQDRRGCGDSGQSAAD